MMDTEQQKECVVSSRGQVLCREVLDRPKIGASKEIKYVLRLQLEQKSPESTIQNSIALDPKYLNGS